MRGLEGLFFELLQVSLGTRICLSHTPTAEEWGELYAMAKKQSLVGICFAGIQALKPSETLELPETMRLRWMGMAAKIQQRNEVLNRQCVELQAKLATDGFRSSILKGQGIAALYGEHLRNLRQPGDIDIFVDCGREKAIEFAKKIQDNVDWDYKHLHLNVFADTEVEVHYVPEVVSNLWTNRKLQVWHKESEVREAIFSKIGELITPSVKFNLVYILLHAYRHFLYEGVGLRQLMDYFFVLKTNGSEGKEGIEIKERILTIIKSFNMIRFTKGVMWIMKEIFGLPEQQMLCEADEKEGRNILNEVMRGGNFGHYDERLKSKRKGNWKVEDVKRRLKHAWHLLRHYPDEVIWSPVFIVWHKAWIILHRR